MNFPRFFAALFVFVTLATASVAQAQTPKAVTTIQVNGKTVKLPQPKGLKFVSNRSDIQWFFDRQNQLSPNVKPKAVFAPKGIDLQGAQFTGFDHFCDVNLHVQLEGMVRITDFVEFKSWVSQKSPLGPPPAGMNDMVRKSGLTIEDPEHPHQIVNEFNAVGTVNPIEVGGKKRIMGFVVVHHENSLIQIHFHSSYDGDQDVRWVVETARKWVRDFNQMN